MHLLSQGSNLHSQKRVHACHLSDHGYLAIMVLEFVVPTHSGGLGCSYLYMAR